MPQQFSTYDPWLPGSLAYGEWGILHVIVDGRDVTYFRDTPAQILRWSSAEPFGDVDAVVRFPALTIFDELGSAASGDDNTDLSWLYDGAPVELVLLDEAGDPVDLFDGTNLVWEGFIDAWEHSADETTNSGLTVTCTGAIYQADDYVRAPTYEPPVSYEDLIRFQFDSRAALHLKTAPLVVEDGGPPGSTQYTGSWNRLLTDFLSEILGDLVEEAAGLWTINLRRPRVPVLRLKDTTTVDWTLSAGQPGLAISGLRQDFAGITDVIYGEGTDAAGARWRNATIEGTPGATRTAYEPIGKVGTAHPVEGNPSLDLSKRRRERFVRFPVGTSLAQASTLAQRYVDRDADPGWFGTLILRTDPEDGSRLTIRAGENVRLRYAFGTGTDGILLHVLDVSHNHQTMETTLYVDSRARDRIILDRILNREFGNSLDRRFRVGSLNDLVNDEQPPWDVHAGMGFIPSTAAGSPNDTIEVPAATWTIVKIAVPTLSTIETFEMRAYEADGVTKRATPFHVSLYSEAVTADELPPDPFAPGVFDDTAEEPQSGSTAAASATTGTMTFTAGKEYPDAVGAGDSVVLEWESGGDDPNVPPERVRIDGPHAGGSGTATVVRGVHGTTRIAHADGARWRLVTDQPWEVDLVRGYGTAGDRAGYWPGAEPDGSPVSGVLKDESTWQYRLDVGENTLWVALWCAAGAHFRGRLFPGVS